MASPPNSARSGAMGRGIDDPAPVTRYKMKECIHFDRTSRVYQQRHTVTGRLILTQWTCDHCDIAWFETEPAEGSPLGIERARREQEGAHNE